MEAQIAHCDTSDTKRSDWGTVMRWMRRGDAADSVEHDSPGEADGSSARSRLLRGLLLIFCCWHAGFLIISIFPRRLGQEDPGHLAMDLYRLLTGGRQLWSMFETIPVLHSLDARLEGEDETGGKITAGCVLPGFKPYPKPEQSRYYVLFHRLLFTANGVGFREAYLRKVAQLLPAQRGSMAGRNWVLVMDTAYTRNLVHSRRDGQLSLQFTKTFGPAGAGGNSP